MTADSRQQTRVMGILNLTPDSFSDGGLVDSPEAAIRRALAMVEQGADWVDVGAESTRPGADRVGIEDEWARLEPVLTRLTRTCQVPISVDTYKGEVARRALTLGVQMINDVWGGMHDDTMLPVVSEAQVAYVWMHNRKAPATEDVVATVMEETEQGIARCLAAGIAPDRLWIDPGIGFAKTPEQNLDVLRALNRYCALGYPVLLGASRKRFIGRILGGEPTQRLEGSLAVAAWGVLAGVRCIRVHDVAETVKVCRMLEAIRDGAQAHG